MGKWTHTVHGYLGKKSGGNEDMTEIKLGKRGPYMRQRNKFRGKHVSSTGF